jgi:hypothetical protein
MAPPLYPGYYPGTPQPRYQPTGGSPLYPTEFNTDQMMGQIDRVYANFEQFGPGLPNWVYERLIDDWKQNLKVSMDSINIRPEEYDEYDAGTLPGASQIQLNINPVDIINDPGKWASMTAKDWYKATFNWNDLESRYRRQVWRNVFSEADTSHNVFEDISATALGTNIAAQAGIDKTYYGSGSGNPIYLYGRKIYRDDDRSDQSREMNLNVKTTTDPSGNIDIKTFTDKTAKYTKGVDVMAEFADSVANYDLQARFGPKREVERDKVSYAGYRAVVTEMQKDKTAIAVRKSNKALDDALTAAETKLSVYETMQTVSKDFNDYKEDLSKMALKNQSMDPTKVTQLVDRNVDRLKDIDRQISDLAANGLTKQASELQSYANEFKSDIERVLKTRALDPSQVANMNVKSAINSLTPAISGGMAGRPIGSSRTFNQSAMSKVLRSMDNEVGRQLGGTDLGTLVREVAKHDNKLASRAVVGGMVYVRNTAEINAGMEVFNALESGKFMETYVWNRMRNYVMAYTPAGYTDRFLKKNNYFGLKVVDQDRFEKSMIYKLSKPFGDKEVPNKLYGNWFTLRDNFARDPNLHGVTMNARLYGGNHFKVVGSMHRLIKENDWAKNPKAVAHFMTIIDTSKGMPSSAQIAQSLRQLNPNSEWMKKLILLNDGKVPSFVSEMQDKNMVGFMTDLATFKLWLQKNKGRLGMNIDENDPRYYLALFSALKRFDGNPDFINITKKYAGMLEKVFVRLNQLQTFLARSIIGKIAAPAAYVKRIISDWISTGITRALQLLSSAGSAGALAPVVAALEPVIRFVVRITVDKVGEYVKVFYNAIVKADIDGVFKLVDKQVERSSKLVLGIMAAFLMFFIIPGDMFMGTIATTFSPVDNTLSAGAVDIYDATSRRGSGQILDPISKQSSDAGCFEFGDYSGQDVTILGQTAHFGPWPSNWLATFKDEAVKALQANTNGYLDRLCEAGPIRVAWAIPTTKGGFCGIASGTDLIILGYSTLCYGPDGTYPADWYKHHFAHETGHIYDSRVGRESFAGISFDSVTGNGEGTFRTYTSAHCDDANLDSGEDFAETIGNWVQINSWDCTVPVVAGENCNAPADTFWGTYRNHCAYADKVLTRDYVPSPPSNGF